MPAPNRLYGQLMALMHASTDAVIAVSAEGGVRVCARGELATTEHEAYSRDLLLAEGVIPTPAALQEVAARITAEPGEQDRDLVASA